jgi:uncharacterized membrane protein HdeD (DUF308 family)
MKYKEVSKEDIMNAIKNYGWLLKVTGAALILGLAIFLEISPDGEKIVSVFIGFAIVMYSIVRLVPFVKTQKSDLIKTINIIEITIDFAIGLALVLIPLLLTNGFGTSDLFRYLLGSYLLLRGIVHFYSVSSHHEKSDVPLFVFHIAAIVVGTIMFYESAINLVILIHFILALSIISGGYLGYDGYKGYHSYRRQKTLTMPAEDEVSDVPVKEKVIPIMDEVEPEQDQIVS